MNLKSSSASSRGLTPRRGRTAESLQPAGCVVPTLPVPLKKTSRGLGKNSIPPGSMSPSSSLDSSKHNRNSLCGSMSLGGPSEQDGKKAFVFTKLFCKSWVCQYCGPRKAKKLRKAIAKAAGQYQLNRLLTVTLDSKKIPEGMDPMHYIQEIWSKFRVYLGRFFGESIDYIRIVELQQSGMPHYHVLLNRYIPQATVSDMWDKLGGGRIVDIRMIYDAHRIPYYMTKYITKRIILSVPVGTRRFTTSRSIRLFDPIKANGWRLFRSRLEYIFEILKGKVSDINFGDNHVMISFVVELDLITS